MKRIILIIFILCQIDVFGQAILLGSSSVTPVVTTQAVTSIGATTATGNGTVVRVGSPAISVRGSCWNTSTDPTTANSKTSDGTTVGAFTSALTSLTFGATYYVRAYVTNTVSTYYGANVTFVAGTIPTVTTTAITSIAATSATSGGNVTADGGGTVSDRGVCWNTSTNPTTANDKTSDGTGTGSFASSITGVTTGTLYYVRAYASNAIGTAYGSNLTFTPSGPATVTTDDATNIATTSATVGGNVTGDGGSTVTERGVCYKFTTNPTTANTKKVIGSGTGTFSSSITSLASDWTYYLKAYAINSAGTYYGNEITFTTPCVAAPSIGGITVKNQPWASGVIAVEIVGWNSATATEAGICYGASSNPTTSDTKITVTVPVYPTQSYIVTISGLTPGATYHIRGYGINSCGTGYSGDLQATAGL